MTAVLFTSLFLLAFLVLLALRSLDQPGAGDSKNPSAPWIHPLVSQQLQTTLLPFTKRQFNESRRPRAVIQPTLTEVSPWDWKRIPGRIPASAYRPVATDKLAKLREQLNLTEGNFVLRSPYWPVCCEQLGVLLFSQGTGVSLAELEQDHGLLDRAFLENELRSWGAPGSDPKAYFDAGWSEILQQMREGIHNGQGINFFKCKECCRIYIASCSP